MWFMTFIKLIRNESFYNNILLDLHIYMKALILFITCIIILLPASRVDLQFNSFLTDQYSDWILLFHIKDNAYNNILA